MKLISGIKSQEESNLLRGVQYSSEKRTNVLGDFVHYIGDFMGLRHPRLIAMPLSSFRVGFSLNPLEALGNIV